MEAHGDRLYSLKSELLWPNRISLGGIQRRFSLKRYLKARAAIVLPVVSLGVFASPIFVGRLERIMEGVDGSTSHRVLGSLELTENILNQYPLAGIGLGSVQSVAQLKIL